MLDSQNNWLLDGTVSVMKSHGSKPNTSALLERTKTICLDVVVSIGMLLHHHQRSCFENGMFFHVVWHSEEHVEQRRFECPSEWTLVLTWRWLV